MAQDEYALQIQVTFVFKKQTDRDAAYNSFKTWCNTLNHNDAGGNITKLTLKEETTKKAVSESVENCPTP